ALGDFERSVARAVIDDDDLVVGVVEHCERSQALIHRPLGIVGADHYRDPRVALQRRRQYAGVLPHYLVERRFRPAFPVDQTEGPVLDQMTAGEPFVGPGENESASDTRLEGGVYLPGQDSSLPLLSLTERIYTEFGQHERLVEGDIVQPRDVSAKSGLVVQVDVEADEIGEIDRQIFGRWIIGVADQRLRMLGLGADDEASEKA